MSRCNDIFGPGDAAVHDDLAEHVEVDRCDYAGLFDYDDDDES